MKIGFLSLLTITFVVLKLTGQIAWSWWLVLSPLIGAVALFVVFLILYAYLNWRNNRDY